MYVQSDTLLLADVFENFRKMCLKIYKLDPVKLLSGLWLAWQAALKKIKIIIIIIIIMIIIITTIKKLRMKRILKLELLTDIDVINSSKRY